MKTLAEKALVDPNPAPVQQVARWGKIAWCVILGVAGAVELYGVFHPAKEDTLSETTRWLWRTDTEVGKWAFRASWVAFACWFGPHIVKIERQVAAAKKLAEVETT